MGAFIFLRDYIIWHYGRALQDFFGITRDLLWFVYHFFSLPLLTRTLFSPFARIRSGGISILDIEGSLQNITLNLVSRIIGLMLRTAVITLGTITEITLALLLAIAFICWLLLPLIIIFLLAFSTGILS